MAGERHRSPAARQRAGQRDQGDQGLADVSQLESVTYELLRRGLDEAVVRTTGGENTSRVMAAVERLAEAP